MSSRKRRKLESTLMLLQQRYGPQVIRKASDLTPATPAAVSSGFAMLDQHTGCGGLPLGALTVLSGRATSGKLTLAYKALASAQHPNPQHAATAAVAILDLNRHSDPDYLARCGIDLAQLMIVHGEPTPQTVDLLLDLVRSGQLRLLLVDSIADLYTNRAAAGYFQRTLDGLCHQLRRAACGLLLIDEPAPPWQRWLGLERSRFVQQKAALQIELQHERWLYRAGVLTGYRARARVQKSHWRHDKPTVPLVIEFNGTVKAQQTW